LGRAHRPKGRGEVFERNVGTKTPLGIPRGINQLWSAGGIMYAPPIR